MYSSLRVNLATMTRFDLPKGSHPIVLTMQYKLFISEMQQGGFY